MRRTSIPANMAKEYYGPYDSSKSYDNLFFHVFDQVFSAQGNVLDGLAKKVANPNKTPAEEKRYKGFQIIEHGEYHILTLGMEYLKGKDSPFVGIYSSSRLANSGLHCGFKIGSSLGAICFAAARKDGHDIQPTEEVKAEILNGIQFLKYDEVMKELKV